MERIGFFELIPYAFVIGIMVGILAIQRHMSATIQMVVIAAAVLFAGGISVWWFIVGGVGVGAALIGIVKGTGYMTTRIANWKDPWLDAQDKGLQAVQSLMAIGSGGVFGLGLGNGRQKFLYLPEPQNDFIFAVVCEELGLVGACLVLLLFALVPGLPTIPFLILSALIFSVSRLSAQREEAQDAAAAKSKAKAKASCQLTGMAATAKSNITAK